VSRARDEAVMTVISFPPTMTSTSPWAVHVWFEDPVGNRDSVGTTEFCTQSDAIASVCATLSRLRDTDSSRLGGDETAEICVAQLVGSGVRRTAFLFSTWEPIEWDENTDEDTMAWWLKPPCGGCARRTVGRTRSSTATSSPSLVTVDLTHLRGDTR
jgi:hypothetical protein